MSGIDTDKVRQLVTPVLEKKTKVFLWVFFHLGFLREETSGLDDVCLLPLSRL